MSKLTPLGLPEDAAPEEAEARYAELTAFLRSAAVPASLRPWAEQQLSLLDEFYASGGFDEWETPQGTKPLPSASRRQAQRVPKAGPRPAAQKNARQGAPNTQFLSHRWAGHILAGLVAGVVVVVFIAGFLYLRGEDSGDGHEGVPSATGQMQALDEGRVAELKTILADQPDNLDALFELGERYFQAGQWEEAIEWFTKLVALDPTDIHALTDIGTANFNLGQFQEAKTHWEQVLQIAPNDVQAHYNLGFYYANVEPRDLESAMREWEAVIALDPNSPQAQTAQVHIDGLKAEVTPQAPVSETP